MTWLVRGFPRDPSHRPFNEVLFAHMGLWGCMAELVELEPPARVLVLVNAFARHNLLTAREAGELRANPTRALCVSALVNVRASDQSPS